MECGQPLGILTGIIPVISVISILTHEHPVVGL